MPALAQAPQFARAGPLASDTGHLLVEWRADAPATLELARTPDFANARQLYRGHNHAYFISGLADGEYYLRLRGEGGAASSALQLNVTHQSLGRALWLALVGAIITLAIIAVVIRGAADE